jgi:hypothetical protein
MRVGLSQSLQRQHERRRRRALTPRANVFSVTLSRVFRHTSLTNVFSVTLPARSIAVTVMQVIRGLEDAMSIMILNRTRTWSDFSWLWSALKLNFAEWQRRAVSRRLQRTAADIEASKLFWHQDA